MSRLPTPAPTSDAAPVQEPVLALPSQRTIAFAMSVVQSKPPELSIEEYIKLLRQHIAKGRCENALSSVYSHLDRSAYWRSEADRTKTALKAAENEAIDLRREITTLKGKLDHRPPIPVKKRKKPDEDVILVPRSPKKTKRAASPEQSAAMKMEHPTEVEFCQAGEIGNDLLRSVFHLLAALRTNQRTKPAELAYQITRASSAIPQIVLREVKSIVTEQGTDSKQLQTSLLVISRAISTVLAGYVRMNHAHDVSQSTATQGNVVYSIVSMFRDLLRNLQLLSSEIVEKSTMSNETTAATRPSTARPCSPVKSSADVSRPSTAQPALTGTGMDGASRPSTARPWLPDKSKGRGRCRGQPIEDLNIKENPPLSLYASFLGSIVGMINPRVEANQALFEGLTYCILDRLGDRLYYIVFGQSRARNIESEIQQHVDVDDEGGQTAPVPSRLGNKERQQIELEAPYLLHLLSRIIVAAPAYFGNIHGSKNSKVKVSSKSQLKNTLAMSAKECLQRTLVNCIFGTEGADTDDPFKECLKMPGPGEATLTMPKVKDADVLEHFKEEVWRCVGWEILAKEGNWGPF